MKKLYKLTVENYDDWFVIAKHPTEAEDKLKKHFNDNDYNIYNNNVMKIEVIATEAEDKRFLTNHFLLT